MSDEFSKSTPWGFDLIAAERQRQIEGEGWTPEHDDEHECFELSHAAIAYTHEAIERSGGIGPHSSVWPFSYKWWKPSADPVRNLVKAGALIAAEIDRLRRKQTLGFAPESPEAAIRADERLKVAEAFASKFHVRGDHKYSGVEIYKWLSEFGLEEK